ncbi:sugar-binding protein [Paenibacillus sp. PL2-23]|uniref:sugar-binding protein n=1 Tax=Paenibacillus sp. PL2-23 TaxID=2100729 RepID=UPI0030F9E4B8
MSKTFLKAISIMLTLCLALSLTGPVGMLTKAEASSTLLSNDFENGDTSAWNLPSGFALHSDAGNNVLKYTYNAGSSTRKYAVAGESNWSHYEVELKVTSASDSNSVGVYARYNGENNHYLLRLDTATDTLSLVKRLSGNASLLGSAPIVLDLNTWYTLKLEVNDDQITGYVDGVPLVSVTDASHTTGKIAIGGYSKSSYAVDDVIVRDLRQPTRLEVQPESVVLLEDEVRQLSATVFDQGDQAMNDVSVTWSSDDASVAAVDGNGFTTGMAAGSTVVRATYGSLSDSAAVTVEELVTEAPLELKRTLQPLEVDGALDESVWSLDRTARKSVLGVNGNTVNFGALWDEDYLYVGVQVFDDALWNDSTDSYDDDSVEVFIDADHNHGSTYDVNDWHFRKGYNDTALFERLNERAGVLHASAAIPGGYAVELAIPWINLGLTAGAGLDFGFDLAVNDDDTGGVREGQLVWSGIADNYKNTVAFGDAILLSDTVGTTPPPTQPAPVDRYVTPQGAGSMDGSSWANAFAGDTAGGLQAAWDATGDGHTLFVGSGTYTVPQTVELTRGGTDESSWKRLLGVDTGAGAPVFQGDYTLSNQVQRSLIDVPLGVSYWHIENIVIRNYYYGVYANGQHEGVRVIDVDMHDMSDGVYMWGRATRSNPDAGSHDIVIKGGHYTNYTKSAVRFRNGNYNASVIGVTADAGGQANYAAGSFPMGFRIGNSPESEYIFDHDIVFQDVVSSNSWHENGGNYWNGDGFAAERQTYNLTYVRSKAFDSTDGGWDDKSINPVFIDTVAFGNKRNYRIWSADKAVFIRSIGAYSYKRGGNGDSLGLWVGSAVGKAELYYSTLYNNENTEIALEGATNQVDIYDSIIGDSNGGALYVLNGGQVNVTNTEEYIAGVQGNDPQFVNGTNAGWQGNSTDFNSQLYGTAKGYTYPGPNSTPYTVQISAASLSLDKYEEAAVSAQVLDGNGQPVTDLENVIWYSDDAYLARLLQSRGANAVVQGLNEGTTQLVAMYKGAEAKITVTVPGAMQAPQDAEAPVTTTNAPSGWVSDEVEVQLTASDDLSGVASTYYRLNGGEETAGTSLTIVEEGVHTLQYWSVDEAGNAETAQTVEIKVDRTGPVLQVNTNLQSLWPPNGKFHDIIVDVSAEDELSGTASIVLTGISSNEAGELEDIQDAEYGTFDTRFKLRAKREGSGSGRVYTVSYRATDAAGNVSTGEGYVVVEHDQSKKEK